LNDRIGFDLDPMPGIDQPAELDHRGGAGRTLPKASP
jgi:hypothetical protein